MADDRKRVKIWYDPEGDYLEVIFDRKPGYFRETENDQVMEKVDDEGNVLGDMEATGIRPTFAETLERAGVHFEWTELAMKAWR